MAWPTGKSRKEYNNQRKASSSGLNILHIIGHDLGRVGDGSGESTDGNNDSSPISTVVKQKQGSVVTKADEYQGDCVNAESANTDDIGVGLENLVKLVDYKGKYEECVCQHCRVFEERVREVVGKILKGG